jgi:type VI secretion system secreted protein VgrG
MQLASGKRFNVNAGKGISLFSHSDGITQIAHNGDFTLQSQHDDMKLVSAKDIKVTAAKRMIAMAEEEMTFIVSGGAYLRLKGGDIEIGGPGNLTVKTAEHHWNGPASGKTEMPSFGAGMFERTPRLVRATDGKPVEGMQVHIERDGAAPITGETNAAGEGPKIKGDRLELLKVTFKKLLK